MRHSRQGENDRFAAGSINLIHKPPRNPWSVEAALMPGGSSSGSAVAMAAGLCALSLGSDTGGSVRQPAALCGTFGYKCTSGMWPVDGVFPLSATLDSLGLFARTASDAAIAYGTLEGKPVPRPASLRGLRLGKPRNRFFDDLQPEVESAVNAALEELQRAGVEIVPFDLPEVSESDGRSRALCPPSLRRSWVPSGSASAPTSSIRLSSRDSTRRAV
jgi:Asp-tRNAAsn/Glu-tRNAGln amidotransferase A subunit and related amidases